ncbi:MAG: EAL domain-containing protein [Actinomycetota bacterium]
MQGPWPTPYGARTVVGEDDATADGPLRRLLEAVAALCEAPLVVLDLVDPAGPAKRIVVVADGVDVTAHDDLVRWACDQAVSTTAPAQHAGEGHAPGCIALPVRDDHRRVLGALCLVDSVARGWSSRQIRGLQQIADSAAVRLASLQARDDNARSQLRAQAVFDTAMDAIVLMDGAGLLVDCNDAARELFGWAAGAAVGRPLGALLIPADEREDHRRGLTRHLVDGVTRMTGRRVRTAALHSGGGLLPVEVTVTSCGTAGHPLFAAHIRDLRGELALREERDAATALFQTMVEGMPAATYLVSMDRTDTRYLGRQLESWTGHPLEQWLSDPQAWTQALHPDDRDAVLARVEHSTATGEPLVSEHRFVAADGAVVRVSVQESTVLGAGGEPTGRLGVITDVTALHDAAQLVESAHRQVNALLAAAPLALFIIDPAGVYTHVEGSALALIGVTPAYFVGRSIALAPPELGEFVAAVERALTGEDLTTVMAYQGSFYELSLSHTSDEEGTLTCVIGVAVDVTHRTLAERALAHQSTHDGVTGLLNRTGLLAQVDEAIGRAVADGGQVAVAVLDIDRFRSVNDSFGHAAGDEVLSSISATLTQALLATQSPATTVLGRQGADEFVLVMDGPGTDHDTATTVVDALLAALAGTPAAVGTGVHEVEFAVSATAGLSIYPVDATSTEELLAHADLATYETKRTDRGAIGDYDPVLDRSRSRLSMTARLRRAIAARQITAVFQPVVDLVEDSVDGRPVCRSVEALARWTDDELGVVSPLDFIDLAEDTGLIVPLGRLMLERTCEQLARWRADGLLLGAAVNVSVAQLRSPTMLADLDAALAAHGISPDELSIELTESAAMQGQDRVLAAIRGRGVRVAIDDFGTGHSSLARLRDLDVDLVKLDRSFVSALPGPRARSLISAFVAIAEALDLSTVAEGIETPAERDWLRAAGVRSGQGYLFGRPMSGEQLAQWARPPVSLAAP